MTAVDEGKRLVQSLATRVVDLESENTRLKREITSLTESQKTLASKNRLFEAKILELQARLLYSNPSKGGGGDKGGGGGGGGGHDATPRFRSPLIKGEGGGLVYRFEKRPQSARPPERDGPHSSGALTAREGRSSARPGTAHVMKLPVGRANTADVKGRSMSARGARPPRADERSPAKKPATTTTTTSKSKQGAGGTKSSAASPRKTVGATVAAVEDVKASGGGSDDPALSNADAATEDDGDPGTDAGDRGGGDGSTGIALEEELAELRSDLDAGLIGADTRLVIEAAYCIDMGNKALTVRHNPTRYREVADQLKRAAEVTFKGWRVSTRCSEHDWSLNTMQPSGAWAGAANGSLSSLPLGAFEVNLVWEVDGRKRVACMHSKLKSRKFPDTFKMLSSLVKLVGTHAQALLSSGTGEGGESAGISAPSPHSEEPGGGRNAAAGEKEDGLEGGGGGGGGGVDTGGANGGGGDVSMPIEGEPGLGGGSGQAGGADDLDASPGVIRDEVVVEEGQEEGPSEAESPARVVE